MEGENIKRVPFKLQQRTRDLIKLAVALKYGGYETQDSLVEGVILEALEEKYGDILDKHGAK